VNLTREKAKREKETKENSSREKTIKEKKSKEKLNKEKTTKKEIIKEDLLSTPKGKYRSKYKANKVKEEGEDIEFTDIENITLKRKMPFRGTSKGILKYKK
jgi:hypothetical protein